MDKIPKVNNFLCCISLELGGYIIAGLTMVGCALMSFHGIMEIINSLRSIHESGVLIGIIITAISVAFCVIFAIAAILFIRGVQTKTHEQLKLFMILVAIGTLMGFLRIFQFGFAALPSVVVGACIQIYFLICIYSLYEKLKEENISLA